MILLENNYSGKSLECGVDEVGRGCLAGPVVAAAAILPNDFYHPRLRDSKKMSPKAREEVSEFLIENLIDYHIAEVPQDKIDELNIAQASVLAMHKAIEGLSKKTKFILVDGNYFNPYGKVPHACIVKGDSKYASIAASSVLAKVYRDELMNKLSKEYPGYGWEKNKGYGTPDHIEAIKKLGETPYHRKSFNYPGKNEYIRS